MDEETNTTEAVTQDRTAAIVDAWFNETTSNRGLDVRLFNFLSERIEILKTRLAAKE